MLTAENYLSLVRKRGEHKQPLKRVFRNMLRQDLFVNAYGRIASNKGTMTAGVDGETADGMSLAKIDKLIEELRTGNFRWTPVRRVYIPKKDGKKRPLGIPTWKDRLVQEVIRSILEAYYEPRFYSTSHGFRPNRGCHTALRDVATWGGVKWFIEGDIKGCFDNIDHQILLDIIAENIQDEKFLKLLRYMLSAGYMENWKVNQTYSGTPQGGIVSPLLANIFMTKLDKYVMRDLRQKHNRGQRRKPDPEYHKLRGRYGYLTRQEKVQPGNAARIAEIKELRQRTRHLSSVLQNDPDFRRLWYTRYADDFLIGFIGPKSEAKQIKAELKTFLQDSLNLELSNDKTHITHAPSQQARFLGYNIGFPNHHKIGGNRWLTGKATFYIPSDVELKWKQKYTRKGKPIHRPELLRDSDAEITKRYDVEFRGLAQYYKYALNTKALNAIRYEALMSLASTLANKHQTQRTKIFKKYRYKGVRIGLAVEYNGKLVTFGDFSLKRTPIAYGELDDTVTRYFNTRRSELVQRLYKGVCEWDGCDRPGEEVHHIRALADLNKWTKRGAEAPGWVKFMAGRRRKQMILCKEHHRSITNQAIKDRTLNRKAV